MYAPNIDTCINTFLDCTSLTSLDLSGLGMSKATSFNGMFGRMSNITSINLSGWSTSNVTDTTNMFPVISFPDLSVATFPVSLSINFPVNV